MRFTPKNALLGRFRDWTGLVILAAVLLAAPAVLTDFRLDLLGKYVCYAIVAIGIGLAWGKGGMLVLGQGVYFGIGGYAMAMHLKLSDAGPGGVPDFMQLYGDGRLPWWWEPFRNPALTMIAIVLVPSLLAAALGYATFSRKVRGAYFAILSQALAAAFAIFLIGNQVSTGGTNGLTNFRSFFGYDLYDPANRLMLYLIAVGVLLAAVIGYRQLTASRYGELLVACRDAEDRVEFLGYSPAMIKTTGYVIAALLASVGGALFVPIVGIISPADVGIVPSVGLVIGVAIGGRNSLFGPVLGAIVVAWAETSLSEQFPSAWTYAQGLMFMIVVAFLPGGLASIGAVAWLRSLPGRLRRDATEREAV
ncbi:urea ABC transporter permease subunit UrtC [Microlunatus sp. GCM10028923]|uniref:urea ABC transporter permease subunit UrtC n=1 Tax=Microlunatus sp. GCM10028923 TaxID=3273400 RepID=UPI0036099E91